MDHPCIRRYGIRLERSQFSRNPALIGQASRVMMDGTRTRMDTDPLCAVLAPPSAERLRQRLGVEADARVELATTGWCKVVVLFETIAVLVPRHHEFVPAIRREIRALGALDSVGLPGAPRLYEVIEEPVISPFPLAVVERVAGASLESVEPELSRQGWRNALRGVGAAIAMVHDRARGPLDDRDPADHRAILHGLLDSSRDRREEVLRVVSNELGVEPRRAEPLASALAAATTIPNVVVHNDLHEAQVMIGSAGVTGLVDWQTASIGHPFVDFDVLQWGRGALSRLDPGPADHRRAMWEGALGDWRYGEGIGKLLQVVWTLNDGWWAATQPTAPVTDFPLGDELRSHLMDRARALLEPGR